jgi:NAD(P)-dependent dehydrogenase (short-subunit alcohol dehydrogenase family)
MLSQFEIAGKTILLTGATSGIGYTIAQDFLSQGAQIIGVGRNIQVLDSLKRDFEDLFIGIEADLSERSELIKIIDSVNTELNGIVHSAGVIHRRPLKMITSEIWDETLQINTTSGLELTRDLFKKKKISKDASIVFLSSVASDYAAIGNISYMASKGAVKSMVKGLALELAAKGIRVNGVEPGLIKTALTSQVSDDELNDVLSDYPLGRLGSTTDIAHAVQYLISSASNWMTGQFLRIDGGLTLK